MPAEQFPFLTNKGTCVPCVGFSNISGKRCQRNRILFRSCKLHHYTPQSMQEQQRCCLCLDTFRTVAVLLPSNMSITLKIYIYILIIKQFFPLLIKIVVTLRASHCKLPFICMDLLSLIRFPSQCAIVLPNQLGCTSSRTPGFN